MPKEQHISSKSNQKHPKIRGISFNQIIPNALTLASACVALSGVQLALNGSFEIAVICVLLAGLLDGLDGHMARLLKVQSNFGAQLDSLADFVASGVSPGLILYFWALEQAGGFGWAIALIYIMCCALRLARFNATSDHQPPYARNYFQGVPAPAGATLVLFPMIIEFLFNIHHPWMVYITGVWTMIIGGLMVSNLPTFSLKNINISPTTRPFVLLGIVLLFAGLAGQTWLTLCLISIAYLISFFFSNKSYQALKKASNPPSEKTSS